MATTRREDASRRGRSPPATMKEVSTVSRARTASRSPSSASRSSSGKTVHVDTMPNGTNRKPALRLSTDINNNGKKTTNTQGISTGRNLTRNRSIEKPPPSPSSSSQGSRIGQTTVKDRTLLKSSTFSPSKSVVSVPAKSPGKKTQQVMFSKRGRSGFGNAVKKGGHCGVTKPKEGSTEMIKYEAEVIITAAEEEEMVIGEAEQDLLDSTQMDYHILEELPDPEKKDENSPKSPELGGEEKEEETQQMATEELEEVEAEKSGGEGANLEEPKVKDVEVVTVSKRQGKSVTAYNDVIEETASKLVEKRKSKVLALIGAFETVISLQEPETLTRLSRPPTPQGVNKPQLPIVTGYANQITTTTTADVLTIVHDGAVKVESELGETESTAEDLEETNSAGTTV